MLGAWRYHNLFGISLRIFQGFDLDIKGVSFLKKPFTFRVKVVTTATNVKKKIILWLLASHIQLWKSSSDPLKCDKINRIVFLCV